MIISELYNGKIYAGDTPLKSNLVVEQTGPLQLTVRGGYLQTVGQSRIIHKREISQVRINEMLANEEAEEMPPARARRINVSDISQGELNDFRRRGKIVKQLTSESSAQQKQAQQQLGLLSGKGSQQFSDDTVVIREDDLLDKNLGELVEIPDERIRVWITGEDRKKLHEVNEFIWDVEVPDSGRIQYWLDIGTGPRGISGFLINKNNPDITGIIDSHPPGWSDIQTLIYPFVVDTGMTDLPDIIVLSVLPGFPPGDIDIHSGSISVQ